MTSDAKVGLLLGLVFIFIIAFIINGLPGLHHKDDGNKLTTRMVGLQSNQPGLGANERKVVLEPAPAVLTAGGDTQSAGSTDTRFAMALPQEAPAAVDSSLTGNVVAQPAGNSVVVPVKSTPAIKPQTARPDAPKSYVVEEGDNLSLIAKKFYGDKEGNKLANIKALFEANRKTLASVDELQVGQKLIIPPLAGLTASAPTTAGALSGPGFAKADSIGQRRLTTSSGKSTPAAKSGGIYAVRQGDSLWRIAAQQLGDGNRYKEIAKLNGGVLSDEDDLQVGMQLKMPAR